jgi:flavin reductase (DIM6/NTAB) family NADH-FMN oxidoreductase RutF
MQGINISTIKTWERFYRANFINSLTGFKSVSLIGSINTQGQPNLAIFSSIVHLGADPALVGFINRPLAAAPHTIGNIQATKSYTINHVHAGIIQQAHQTSAKYAIEQLGLLLNSCQILQPHLCKKAI